MPEPQLWVKKLLPLLVDRLSSKHGREFIGRQSGPYRSNQGGSHSGVFFHELELETKYQKSPISTDRADKRFGFEIEQSWSPTDGHFACCGFSLWNKVIARNHFQDQLRDSAEPVARKLEKWLVKYQGNIWLRFDQEGGVVFRFPQRDLEKQTDLAPELAKYGDLDRPSVGKHRMQAGGHVGSKFIAMQGMPESLWSPSLLERHAKKAADFCFDCFQELHFLYELLHKAKSLPDDEVFSETEAYLIDLDGVKQITPRNVVQRLGQEKFRQDLLKAYRGRCAITDCDVVEVLEAAHIHPYAGRPSCQVCNGLLLRSDLHNLFDLKLISINPATMTTAVHEDLMRSEYARYNGVKIQLPTSKVDHPHSGELMKHWEAFGLKSHWSH